MDNTLTKLFDVNEQWSKAVKSADPSFFENSAKGQKVPLNTFVIRQHAHFRSQILWLRCSDSLSSKASSLPRPQATSSPIVTSRSKFHPVCLPTQHNQTNLTAKSTPTTICLRFSHTPSGISRVLSAVRFSHLPLHSPVQSNRS